MMPLSYAQAAGRLAQWRDVAATHRGGFHQLRQPTRVLIAGLGIWIAAIVTLTLLACVAVGFTGFDFGLQSSATAASGRVGAGPAVITERPLFNPMRQAPRLVIAAAPPPPAPPPLERAFQLKGVFINGATAKALLVSPSSGELWMTRGDEIAGWQLETVAPGRVTLAARGERIEVAMDNTRSPR